MYWLSFVIFVIVVLVGIYLTRPDHLVIVTAHWNEDLSWLKKSKWPVIVCDKEGAGEIPVFDSGRYQTRVMRHQPISIL